MSQSRYEFVRLNYASDASEDIAAMREPVLVLWGDADLNVNPTANYDVYRQLLGDNARQKVGLQAGATHSLLRKGWFNYQTPEEWPFYSKALFACLGRSAYVPGVLETISTWINNLD